MPTPTNDQARRLAAVVALGITPVDFELIRRAPFVQAQEMLQALKDRAKKAYKRLAFELHPDRTGNDPEKTELFKMLGQVLTEIDKLQVTPPPPQAQVVFRPVPVAWVQVRHTTTASTTSTTTVRPGYVVFMRPGF